MTTQLKARSDLLSTGAARPDLRPAAVACFRRKVPETKGMTLEQIERGMTLHRRLTSTFAETLLTGASK